MTIRGEIVSVYPDITLDQVFIQIQTTKAYQQELQDIRDVKDLDIEFKKHREKRSLSANAYAWVLIGRIADVLRAGKDETYLRLLKRYGQSEFVSVLSHIDVSGYFKYYEPVANATIQGKEFTHYKVYKGSSEFSTEEMTIFIDGIVSEAKEMGIPTETPEELRKIKERWGIELDSDR